MKNNRYAQTSAIAPRLESRERDSGQRDGDMHTATVKLEDWKEVADPVLN